MKDQSSVTLESMSQAIWYNRWALGKFKKYLNGRILEIGCGIGNFSKLLIKYGELTAIDVNKEYIGAARNEVNWEALIGVGDIEKGNYFFKKKDFDTVVCMNVLEHIKNDRKALKNIYKLLRQRGILVLMVPAQKFLYNSIDKSIGHYRRYEKNEMIRLLQNTGFEVINIRKLNFFGAIGWYIAGTLLKEDSISESKIRVFNTLAPFFLMYENFFEPQIGTTILAIARKIN